MSFKVVAITNFLTEAKSLIKKYPSLQKELQQLGEQLSLNPKQGTFIGKGCYKIRLSIASKGKGKSGGARVITYVAITDDTVFLLSIYDKSAKANISNADLSQLLKFL